MTRSVCEGNIHRLGHCLGIIISDHYFLLLLLLLLPLEYNNLRRYTNGNTMIIHQRTTRASLSRSGHRC